MEFSVKSGMEFVPKSLAKILRWRCWRGLQSYSKRWFKNLCNPTFLIALYEQCERNILTQESVYAQELVVLILLRIVLSKKTSKNVLNIVSDFLIKNKINPVDQEMKKYERKFEHQPDSGYLRCIYVHLLHYATALIERDKLYVGEREELLENILTPFTMMMWETIFPSCFNVETPVSDLEHVYNIMEKRWNSRSYVRSTYSGVWDYMHNVVKEKNDTFEGSDQDKRAMHNLFTNTRP